MATYQLRAMSLGEILDGALTVLRRHFGLFFGLAVVCLGVPTAINLSDTYAGGSNVGLSVLVAVLSVFGYLLLTGASVYVVSEAYLGRTPQFGESLRFAVGKMGAIFVSGLAVGIVTFLALLALVIPGIIVACGYAVTVPVVVLESLSSATDSLGRSWALTKGYKGKAFLLYFITIVLAYAAIIAIGFLIVLATMVSPVFEFLGMVLLAAVLLFVYPFSSCVLTLFYYDLRVRKEAFDLEVLGQQIGASPSVS